MIWLYSTQAPAIKSFLNFEELCDYFKRFEQISSSYADGPHNGKWDFVYQTHRRISALFSHVKGDFSIIEQQAFQNECDLIEIYAGDSHYPEQYVVTPNLDLVELMKAWCFDYAYAHGFTILESFSNELISDSPQVLGQGGIHEYFGEVVPL